MKKLLIGILGGVTVYWIVDLIVSHVVVNAPAPEVASSGMSVSRAINYLLIGMFAIIFVLNLETTHKSSKRRSKAKK